MTAPCPDIPDAFTLLEDLMTEKTETKLEFTHEVVREPTDDQVIHVCR